MQNISVVIPALNEEKTIAGVVRELYKSKYVSEIIVVDNDSMDRTKEIAEELKVKTILCKEKGFGFALKTGIVSSKNNLIFKIDADIKNPNFEWIEILFRNMRNEQSHLAKGYWDNKEDSMPVTNLVAKPLIKINYPDLEYIKMPLSGIYLFDKSVLNIGQMQNNFAFDLDLLISMHHLHYKISQEYLGEVYDNLKPISDYFNMSSELISYIQEKKKYDKCILLFMAHPDDAEIWCGGLISKYALNNNKVFILIATSDCNRKAESLRLINTFPNIQIYFMENEELTNFYNKKNIEYLCSLLDSIRPDIFITHHKDDIHIDHKLCFDITSSALLKIDRDVLPEKLLMCNSYFQNNNNAFKPNIYIDTTAVIDIKMKLIENFASQDIDYWKKMAKLIDSLNGLKASVEYAEAYEENAFYTINRAKEII